MRRVVGHILALFGLGLLAGSFWEWRRQLELSSPHSVRLDLPVQVEPILPREDILATYENTFRCTIYYSPRESGITKEGGFNVALETRPGLGNHKYAADFLRAVQVEGFGRLKEPVEGKGYVRYWSKEWGFIEQPVDNRQRPLVARQSCANRAPSPSPSHSSNRLCWCASAARRRQPISTISCGR